MFYNEEENQVDPKSDTQRRIIDAAGEIFADSGYGHTTVRAICERASVNVAAINYHFGGKKNLYLTVLKYWRARAFEKYPFDPADFSGQPPEERLRAFVRMLLFRVLDEGEGSRFAKLIARELIEPTTGLDVLVDETVRPFFAFLSATVGQFFAAPPPEMTVNLCCLSIAGQIFHLYMGRHVVSRLLHREHLNRREIEQVADHIVRFSLYAIREIAANSQGEGV
jgi:TetR/AcrR family transcriptional regulator, regulator of cefoperazone and chloramphenicol sensitivity